VSEYILYLVYIAYSALFIL